MTATPVPSPASTGLSARLRYWRNRILSSPRFQLAAAANPLTRPKAQAEAARLFNLCTGFVHSQVLLACVQVDLLSKIAARAMTAEETAPLIDLPIDGAERLMKAAASLELLCLQRDGRYTLGDLGASLMGNPSVLAMIRHHRDFYKDLTDPVALLRRDGQQTHLSRFWGYAASDTPGESARESAAKYSALMAETQAFIARDVMAAHDVSAYGHIMDVGGGSGAFLAAIANRHMGPMLTLCDLPPVAALAQHHFAEQGLDHRARALGVDFHADRLPDGADMMTMVRILHDHNDGPVQTLLKKAREALAPGARLLIAEPMANTKGAEAMGDAYFGLYLWAMGSGRARTKTELTDMLHAAGFTRVREAKTHQPLLVRVLIAE
ncbi:MAG: methyltransferase [Pseudomonadota bacterium]